MTIPVKKNPTEAQLEKLASLLLLESRLRESENEVEFGFLIVNDTLSLVSGSTALFWRGNDDQNGAKGEVFSISSTPVPDKNSPFFVWATRFCKACWKLQGDSPGPVDNKQLPQRLMEERSQHVAQHAVWLPMRMKGRFLGTLVIWRDKRWTDPELRILQQWTSTATHAYHALRFSRPRRLLHLTGKSKSRFVLGAALALILVMFIPVRLSVLSQAEIVSSEVTVVRSPLQGVIQALEIESNAPVAQNQHLIRLDDRALRTELEVAQQELEVARAEYRQSSQAAAYSEEAKANLQILLITLEKIIAQVNYLTEQLSRTQITAERSGIAIVENSDEMVGRPVQLGERLLTIMDEKQLELEIWLPVGDDIELPVGSEVVFFPNVAPEQAYRGNLLSMDYRAQMSPLGNLAYKAEASLESSTDAASRIGMRGTAKLYGERVSLFYYLFRRPISFLRQSLGI